MIWKDELNYLALDRGLFGDGAVSFRVCRNAHDDFIGHEFCPSRRVYLRIERRGSCFSAFCSQNGNRWFSLGCVELPAENPIRIGLHGQGRLFGPVFHRACAEVSPIRLEAFHLWTQSRIVTMRESPPSDSA